MGILFKVQNIDDTIFELGVSFQNLHHTTDNEWYVVAQDDNAAATLNAIVRRIAPASKMTFEAIEKTDYVCSYFSREFLLQTDDVPENWKQISQDMDIRFNVVHSAHSSRLLSFLTPMPVHESHLSALLKWKFVPMIALSIPELD